MHDLKTRTALRDRLPFQSVFYIHDHCILHELPKLSMGDGEDCQQLKRIWKSRVDAGLAHTHPQDRALIPHSLHPLFHFCLTSMSPPNSSFKHFSIRVTVPPPRLWPLFSITESSVLMTVKFLNISHFQLCYAIAITWIFSSSLRCLFNSPFLIQSAHFLLPFPFIYSICPLP